MKKLFIFIAVSIVISCQSNVLFGQKRPVKKTPAPVSKPKVAGTPTEVEAAPAKKTAAEVSPAQSFFNLGLKCDAKDYDCQISNYTKAINLNLNTKEVFKNRGNAFLQRKDFDKAIADFTKLIELDLNDASGYKNRGRIFLENSNSPQAINAAIRDFTSAIDLEPKDIEAYKLRSSAYLNLRNYDKAKADMDKISAIEPNNVDLVIIQGEMFLADKQYEKAVEVLTKAIGIKPASKLYFNRANAYVAQKKYDLAISDFSKVIELDPKNADAYNARGNAYLQLDKADLAIQDINKAIGINPTNSGSLIDLAKSLERQMKYDAAIKIYDLVLASAPKDDASQYFYNRGRLSFLKEDANSAIADATRSLEVNPKNAKAFELRCMAFIQLKDYQSALEDCSDAIDLDSTLDNAYTSRGNAAHLLTGKLEGQAQNDIDKGSSNSVANANKILAQKPDDFDALVNRASGNMGLKNYAAAIQDYKKLIELNPQYEQAYNLLASCNIRINEYTEATVASNIQTYTQGISANPESVTLYFSRALTYMPKDDRSGVNDLSKAILNYSKKTKPTETEKRLAKSSFFYGINAYERLKDNTNALATINKCDELFPDNSSCLTYRGEFYLNNLNDYQKAVDAYNKAIDLFDIKTSVIGNYAPNLFYGLAESYLGLNDKVKAIATINRGLSSLPNDDSMWQRAGMFYEYKIKDTGKAREHYNKAAQLGNDFAKQTLGYMTEAKQRKEQRRNAAILSIMGAVNQGLETYNSSRQRPSTPQTPQSNAPSSPQTTQSGGTSNATGSQNSGNDCPPSTGLSQTTNTGAAEPGTQKEYGWSAWQSHPGYRGLSMRSRPMFQQKGQSYWYFEMEIKNNYQEEVTVSPFTSDKCKMRNNEINELYSDSGLVTISAGGTGRESFLRSADSSRVKYWVTMYRKSGNGKIAKHDDGSLPLKCQIYPNGQDCPSQP